VRRGMEAVFISGLISAALAAAGLFVRDLNRRLNGKVNGELCAERTGGISRQLEKQEAILLRNEQRLIGIEKKLAFQNGERNNEFDRD
jgi:hypothetical protein